MTQDSTVGTRRMVKLAQRWVEADVRAAALVRRPDVAPRPVTLAPDMLLVLRNTDLLLLAASARWLLGAPGTRLARWMLDAVDVELAPGCGLARSLHIVTQDDTLVLAAPWLRTGQRAALERISRAPHPRVVAQRRRATLSAPAQP
ncbi:MAG TPA: hypothetical protein VI300_11720 [Solirubrobacter sp.]